ncbi:hypothetical protein SCB71_04465 [Herbiconiux sp. KACC 21604]|uniref:hypothetical protein n=1 Tax=unclassified Herbiconiux TaxID=2618217 RepID=UPI001493057E|nr:hypothetical protein [Herbiconiux sp. SALV-R1]QJU52611.1 hypothetical protein HL652_02435 [Herbiconiux sp. SALV-R1]WPO87502.1 hypothetical protein SCB71_04465 [Herbiconiux sp. KACC 21604]
MNTTRSTTFFWVAGILAIGLCLGFGVFALAVGHPEVAGVFAVIGIASIATLPGVRGARSGRP